jgi:hypothetical protein
MTATRTIEECQQLVRLWLQGKHDEVVEELGGEPSDAFLRDYRPGGPYGPVKIEAAPVSLLSAPDGDDEDAAPPPKTRGKSRGDA